MGLIDDILGIKPKAPQEPKDQGGAKEKKGPNWGGSNPYTNRKSFEDRAKFLPSTTKPFMRPYGSTTAKERETMAREVLGNKGHLTSDDMRKISKKLEEDRQRATTHADREKIQRQSEFFKQITNQNQKSR